MPVCSIQAISCFSFFERTDPRSLIDNTFWMPHILLCCTLPVSGDLFWLKSCPCKPSVGWMNDYVFMGLSRVETKDCVCVRVCVFCTRNKKSIRLNISLAKWGHFHNFKGFFEGLKLVLVKEEATEFKIFFLINTIEGIFYTLGCSWQEHRMSTCTVVKGEVLESLSCHWLVFWAIWGCSTLLKGTLAVL